MKLDEINNGKKELLQIDINNLEVKQTRLSLKMKSAELKKQKYAKLIEKIYKIILNISVIAFGSINSFAFLYLKENFVAILSLSTLIYGAEFIIGKDVLKELNEHFEKNFINTIENYNCEKILTMVDIKNNKLELSIRNYLTKIIENDSLSKEELEELTKLISKQNYILDKFCIEELEVLSEKINSIGIKEKEKEVLKTEIISKLNNKLDKEYSLEQLYNINESINTNIKQKVLK